MAFEFLGGIFHLTSGLGTKESAEHSTIGVSARKVGGIVGGSWVEEEGEKDLPKRNEMGEGSQRAS